eukprot:TRINITY_DN1028_c0_g1_i2.p1 TRINITY_DN1028_c0_g1~~TRINITY_DN1028_c0_g1_i2.p1  ORF type:complete len:324 (+),score=102.65 TRINITY_DN1028_c0_g1_i2:27-974(+)
MSNGAPKKYGLLVSKAKVAEAPKSAKRSNRVDALFGSDDDNDGDESVGQTLLREAEKNRILERQRIEEEKLNSQSADIYDYDGVYDEMQKKKVEAVSKKETTVVKSKWIATLKMNAEMKKKEFERSLDRMALREQAKEDHLFEGKEKYVTSAYKQKLVEEKRWQEEQARIAAREEAEDVTKKSDLSDLYRHMYSSIPSRNAAANTANTANDASAAANDVRADSIEERRAETARKIAAEDAERQKIEAAKKAEREKVEREKAEREKTDAAKIQSASEAKESADLQGVDPEIEKKRKAEEARQRYLARKKARATEAE